MVNCRASPRVLHVQLYALATIDLSAKALNVADINEKFGTVLSVSMLFVAGTGTIRHANGISREKGVIEIAPIVGLSIREYRVNGVSIRQ